MDKDKPKPDPLQAPATKQEMINLEQAVVMFKKHVDARLYTLVQCYDRLSGLIQQLVDARDSEPADREVSGGSMGVRAGVGE